MKRWGKRLLLVLPVWILAAVLLTGCSGKTEKEQLPTVKLSLWWSDDSDMELVEEVIEQFKAKYADQVVFEITVSVEEVTTCRETVLAAPEAAADIFVFADDQFEGLWRGGALAEITETPGEVIEANGGSDSGACRTAVRDGKLYAYPITAGNGYFLYYNADYFTEEDVKSLDRILEVSAQNGKKTLIDFSSGWYIYSFFKGAGLEVGLNEDGVTNYCNWNAVDTKYKGTDVAEAMLAVAAHEGFVNGGNDQFLAGLKDGSIIAGISGTWNASFVEEAFGEGYAAAELPCYTLAGDSVQMCSFLGYKLVGVNAHSEEPYWAMKLSEMLTSEEMQLKRFRKIGECPANVNAAASPEIQASPAIAAFARQSEFAYIQDVGDAFWNPVYIFGVTIAGGNADGQELQILLDNMVKEITASGGETSAGDTDEE